MMVGCQEQHQTILQEESRPRIAVQESPQHKTKQTIQRMAKRKAKSQEGSKSKVKAGRCEFTEADATYIGPLKVDKLLIELKKVMCCFVLHAHMVGQLGIKFALSF